MSTVASPLMLRSLSESVLGEGVWLRYRHHVGWRAAWLFSSTRRSKQHMRGANWVADLFSFSESDGGKAYGSMNETGGPFITTGAMPFTRSSSKVTKSAFNLGPAAIADAIVVSHIFCFGAARAQEVKCAVIGIGRAISPVARLDINNQATDRPPKPSPSGAPRLG